MERHWVDSQSSNVIGGTSAPHSSVNRVGALQPKIGFIWDRITPVTLRNVWNKGTLDEKINKGDSYNERVFSKQGL